MNILQIGSLFYAVIEENNKINVISNGYHTKEMCLSAIKLREIT